MNYSSHSETVTNLKSIGVVILLISGLIGAEVLFFEHRARVVAERRARHEAVVAEARAALAGAKIFDAQVAAQKRALASQSAPRVAPRATKTVQ